MHIAMSLAGMAAAALVFASSAPPALAASIRTQSFTSDSVSVTANKKRSLISTSRLERKASKRTKRGGGVRAASIVKPAGGVLGSTGTPGGPNVRIGVSSAAFTQTIGGDGVSRTSTGNTAKVAFGGAGSASKSFLQFMGADPVNFALPLDGSVDFAIANLYHFNGQVTEGTGITGARLAFTLTIGSSALPLILNLDHFDRNGASPDRLQIVNPPTAVALPANALGPSTTAFLTVLGFNRTTPQLLRLTAESATGAFTLFGRLTVAPAPVPVPAALPLFATGVAALAFASRRRRQARR